MLNRDTGFGASLVLSAWRQEEEQEKDFWKTTEKENKLGISTFRINSEILVHGFTRMAFDDTVIVKLEPLAAFLGAKERTVMSPVQVTTVNQNTLKVVDLRLRGVCEREG